jgi:hypothetical protein
MISLPQTSTKDLASQVNLIWRCWAPVCRGSECSGRATLSVSSTWLRFLEVAHACLRRGNDQFGIGSADLMPSMIFILEPIRLSRSLLLLLKFTEPRPLGF